MLDELGNLLKKYKIKYVVLENLREGLEKSESAWSACYPWIETQEIIADYCAAEGVYVIYINPNGTSKDYAFGDDEVERDPRHHERGKCKKSKEKVDADKNAAYNILGRGAIKIYRKFYLTEDQDSQLESHAKDEKYLINSLNYDKARKIVKWIKTEFKIINMNNENDSESLKKE